MMMVTPCFSLLLGVIVPLVTGLTSFPERMELGDLYDSVTLTCNTPFQGQLTWKHKEEVLMPTQYEMSGRNLILHELDTPDAGEYSCWGGGEKLDYAYLLLREGDDEDDDVDYDDDDEEDALSCWTQTYSCSFTCHWSPKEFILARLRYHRDGQNPGTWVQINRSTTGQKGFEFNNLPLTNSPFAEESTPMVVTAEAITDSLYLSKTRRFYLRNIVQPDPPESVLCEREGQTLTVTVQPPSSWAHPLSYFPLAHEIEFIYKSNGQTERSDGSVIPRGISKLRARSRDPLVPSAWSKWSPWKNVKMEGRKKWNSSEKKGSRGDKRRDSEAQVSIHCKKKKERKKTTYYRDD